MLLRKWVDQTSGGTLLTVVDLTRRILSKEVFGLTSPLLKTASGSKMGKTAYGAVWLNENMLSPYDYWQFWRNTEDSDVGRFLRLFTDLPMKEIARLETLEGSEINEAKKILADATTALCHSEQASSAARQTAEITFEQGGLGNKLPTFEIKKSRLKQGIPAFQLFREVELANSGGEARRLIKGGGAKLNDVALTSEVHVVTISDLNSDGAIKLSAGKKRHALVYLI